MNKDSETVKMEGEGEALQAMFGSSGWQVAEREFDALIAELKDVTLVPLDAPDTAQQIRDRINTIENLQAWMGSLKAKVNNVARMKTQTTAKTYITRK